MTAAESMSWEAARPGEGTPHVDNLPDRGSSPSGEEHTGQVRMAYRLAEAYRDRMLHVYGLGWLHWADTRWVEDRTGYARRAVLDVLSVALAESINDKPLRDAVARCESAGGIDGVLLIASALVEFAATADDLDADPHLLNCANGTLDLRDRTLRPHNPADMLTKIATGAYLPGTRSPAWESFLERVLPDRDERDYLQRVYGQAVYGRVREHLFPTLIGTGANGKGTCYSAAVNAMGDYGTVINPAILMDRGRDGIGGPELMQLRGARLVVGSETSVGGSLDEAVMKRLTGGDKLTARNLYQPPITWDPSHQIVYVTNALPKVRGNDPAAWRRIRVVPFEVVIPQEERDPELTETLELHADAILTWIVDGYFDYLDNGGMREPASVVHATSEYQAESDAVARFIAERCETHPSTAARTRLLFGAWQDWQLATGEARITEKAFGAELDRLGYPGHRTAAGMLRDGISLSPETAEEYS